MLAWLMRRHGMNVAAHLPGATNATPYCTPTPASDGAGKPEATCEPAAGSPGRDRRRRDLGRHLTGTDRPGRLSPPREHAALRDSGRAAGTGAPTAAEPSKYAPSKAADPIRQLLGGSVAAPSSRNVPSPRQQWEWQRRARCRNLDPEVFFEAEHEGRGTRIRRERVAKRICLDCPVQRECRTHALSLGERYGVWGGTSERDRRLQKPKFE